jgi:branched-chain amino acid transport system substrate-binding protein
MRNKARAFLFTVFLSIIVLGNFAPMQAYAAPKKISNNVQPVIIGVPLPLSGDLQPFGVMMKNSFEMAREAINSEGGIKGHSLELVYADDRGKSSEGERVITRLVKDSKVIMLVGGYASTPTYAMARRANELDIPFLICTASADKITQMGWRNIYRLNPPVSEYTKGLEDFWVKNYKPKSMAIIYEDGLYGSSGARAMMEYCGDRAIEIQALVPYTRETSSSVYFRSILAPLTREPPDVIYMISYLQDGVALVRTIRELNVKSLLCGGAGGFTLPEFIESAGDSANNLITATLWSSQLPYPGAREYFDRYLEMYSSPPDYHGTEAYSALFVAADALKRAASHTPKDIRAALSQTFMMTPFGPVKFYTYEDFERQNSVRTQVLQIINRQFEVIWPPDLATAKFVPPF